MFLLRRQTLLTNEKSSKYFMEPSVTPSVFNVSSSFSGLVRAVSWITHTYGTLIMSFMLTPRTSLVQCITDNAFGALWYVDWSPLSAAAAVRPRSTVHGPPRHHCCHAMAIEHGLVNPFVDCITRKPPRKLRNPWQRRNLLYSPFVTVS